MAPIVILHVAFGIERLVAVLYFAFEWLVFLVNSLMDQHVLLIAESLVAVREWTSKGLGCIVLMHVASEAGSRIEFFLTAFLWTFKGLITEIGAPFGIRSLAEDAFDLGLFLFLHVVIFDLLAFSGLLHD